MVKYDCDLPVGYKDAVGKLHRRVSFRPLTGREEELLATSQGSKPTAVQVTELLAACVVDMDGFPSIESEHLRHLSVIDRHYLLLKLREITFGENVIAIVRCPANSCETKIDVDFALSQLPVAEVGTPFEYTFTLSGQAEDQLKQFMTVRDGRVCFHLPTGADMELISSQQVSGQAEALTWLLSRCLVSVGGINRLSIEQVRSLPSGVRQEIDREIAKATQANEMVMDIACPECGELFSVPFDLQDFFFGELNISETVLRREVHYLAYHYHWSESEIMKMPRDLRRQYIDVLSEEIERLNDATQYA